jgi:hypothetical protein
MPNDALTACPRADRHATCFIRSAVAALHDQLFCNRSPAGRIVASNAHHDLDVTMPNAEKALRLRGSINHPRQLREHPIPGNPLRVRAVFRIIHQMPFFCPGAKKIKHVHRQ